MRVASIKRFIRARLTTDLETKLGALPSHSPSNDADLEEDQVLNDDFPDLTEQQLLDAGGPFFLRKEYDEALRYWSAAYRRNRSYYITVGQYCRALIRVGRWDDFAAVASEVDLSFSEPNRPKRWHDLDELERKIYLEVCLEAAQTAESLAQLSRCVRHIVEKNIPGDFVECGVYKGASIICIIRTLQALGVNDRKIWMYDTFEGMPKPDTVDIFYTQSEQDDWNVKTWERMRRADSDVGTSGSNWVYCSIEEAHELILQTGYPEENLLFVKGLVEDTIPGTIPERISLLRLDTDFYRSTKHELNHLYPLLSDRGFLILDDYGGYRGAQKAADEYIREQRLSIFLTRIDEHVRLAVKC
jgi:O-methyltransferase